MFVYQMLERKYELEDKDINKIEYYIKISVEQNLSVRQLRQRIKNKEYEKAITYFDVVFFLP